MARKKTRLSEDQLDILRDIAEGYSNQEIARRRILTVRGVNGRITRAAIVLGCEEEYDDAGRAVYSVRSRVVFLARRAGYEV